MTIASAAKQSPKQEEAERYGSTWFESWCQLVDAGALHCTASAPQQMAPCLLVLTASAGVGHLAEAASKSRQLALHFSMLPFIWLQ